jgi:hypothetical protein
MDRKAKLDLNTSRGIFLGYTATDKNVVYRDSITGRFKTATHVVFDEAGMTMPAAARSPSAKALQELGYGTVQEEEDLDVQQMNDVPTDICTTDTKSKKYISPSNESTTTTNKRHNTMQVKCLSINATMPTRATDGSVGFDVFSAADLTIQPKTRSAVPLDIAIVRHVS